MWDLWNFTLFVTFYSVGVFMRPQNGQKLRQYQICSQFQSIPDWHFTFEPARHKQTIIYTVCIDLRCAEVVCVGWQRPDPTSFVCYLRSWVHSRTSPPAVQTQRPGKPRGLGNCWSLVIRFLDHTRYWVVLEWFGNPLKTKKQKLEIKKISFSFQWWLWEASSDMNFQVILLVSKYQDKAIYSRCFRGYNQGL